MLIVLYLHHLRLSFGLKSFYFQEFLEKLVIVMCTETSFSLYCCLLFQIALFHSLFCSEQRLAL